MTAAPEAALSVNRLSPVASRPASLVKVESCIWPTTVGAAVPAWVTWTWPVAEMMMSVASCGIEMVGCTW